MAQIFFSEALLRGATVGILLVSAGLFVRGGKRFKVGHLGALFFIGTSAYTVVSSPTFLQSLGALRLFFVLLATFNSVFFWWFATALFDDQFRWRWWRFLPFALIASLFLKRSAWPELVYGPSDNLVQQVVVIPMMLHALWLALAHRSDDLVERRRAFRLIFAALAGLFGLVIAIGEITIGEGSPSQLILTIHASVLFALTFCLALWILPPVTFLEPELASLKVPSSRSDPVDRADLERLTRLMESGVYRQDGLMVGGLARQLSLPEHRLRRLINGALGHRNFSAFLNEYRLEEARRILSDPDQTRRQITQVALDLGYGSVGPFNRAFKAETGLTPTEFRRVKLGGGPESAL